MDYFINYIIEAGLSLGVFTFIYWFILRRETRFKATRFYLIFALLFSTLLPFLAIQIKTDATLQQETTAIITAQTNMLEAVTIYASGMPGKIGQALLSFDYSLLIYILGAFAAFFVIVAGFIQLFRMLSGNRVFHLKKAKLIVSSKEISPYSFFNYIFISDKLTKQDHWKSMVQHELEHVRQGHTFDVLFVDIMMIFQWFNPFYWIIRRMVRENHEFLADTGVLQKGQISVPNYKQLLLSQAIGGSPVITSNFFSVKTIKKRFKMITNNKNKKYAILRYTSGVVLALALTMMFACEKNEIANSDIQDNVLYRGNVMTESELSEMQIEYIKVSDIDRLEALKLYPELKEELIADTYSIVFDKNDRSQIEMMSKLELSEISVSAKNNGVAKSKSGPTFEDCDEQVFVIVENMPEYPGGKKVLREYLAKKIKYPQDAIDKGIEGMVYVTFVVGSDGSVKSPEIARGVDPLLDEEALRVVNSLPKWKPGQQRGQNVAVAYTVPIGFELGGKKQ
jgi:TonB family protein